MFIPRLLWLLAVATSTWAQTILDSQPDILSPGLGPSSHIPAIRSSIEFHSEEEPFLHLAKVQTPDALSSCPVASVPTEIKEIVSLLAQKVKNSIANLQQIGSGKCDALDKQLSTSSASLQTAITQQMVPGTSTSQADINQMTQRAAATNQLVSTVSNLFQAKCIQSADDRLVIQKLLAQLITLGGVFAGGTQGTIVASGGQFLGSIPLFPSEAEQALTIFRKYEEKEERASFLCLYRQMQKTNCLLFASPEDDVIEGIDLTGKSGPYATTLQSIEEIKGKFPELISFVNLLSDLNKNSQEFIMMMSKADTLWNGSIDAFFALKKLCISFDGHPIVSPHRVPENILMNIELLRNSCVSLGALKWREINPSVSVKALFDSYWQIFSLSGYYQRLKADSQKDAKDISDLNYITQTWESLKYFESLSVSLKNIQSASLGNQFRMNFYSLVNGLGNTLAKKSFQSLMKEVQFSPFKTRMARVRSVLAQLDLCQTLDPTLACLYVGGASQNNLLEEWRKQCVGPNSQLCKSLLTDSDKEAILSRLPDQTYLKSLCDI